MLELNHEYTYQEICRRLSVGSLINTTKNLQKNLRNSDKDRNTRASVSATGALIL